MSHGSSAKAASQPAPFSAVEPGSVDPAAPWEPRLKDLLAELGALASDLDGQPEALLALLRQLEELHRTIQDGPFRASLPADRNRLFGLLQGMERSGGWPYIPRLQLRTFMDLLQREDAAAALAASAPPADTALAA